MIRKVLATAGLASVLASQGVSAAMLTYNTEASFAAAMKAGSVNVESLEGFGSGDTPGAGGNLALSFVGAGPAVSAKLTGLDSMRDTAFEPGGNAGRTAKDGSIYWQGGTTSPSVFTIEFAEAIDAFGFWGSDIGDFSTDCGTACGTAPTNVLSIEFYLGASKVETFATAGNSANGSMDFYGFALNGGATFDRVVFTNLTVTAGGGSVADGQGFDRFMIGEAADLPPPTDLPEPGVLGLLGLGLLALGRARRRK